MMTKLREALQNMRDFEIPCGPVSASQPDEVVIIKWTSDDKNFNVGYEGKGDARITYWYFYYCYHICTIISCPQWPG